MTIASALTGLNQDIVAARTAITNKGGTVTSGGGSSQLATDIATIPSGGSAPVITSLNVTPTTSAQTITAPSGTDGYSPVNVAAVTAAIDQNITAENIVSGITILGVNGSATVLNGETRTETLTSSAGNTFTPTSGKNAITSITVTPNNQARSVTPSTSSQTLSVNSGYSGNGTISVSAVTSSIDANITAGNIKKDVTILGVTGSLESGGGGGYQLRRIKDDNNNEIGTAFMEFEDANGNKYDVVCLDAQYRLASSSYCSNRSTIANLPLYYELATSNVWEAKETATFNTQKIIDYCTAKNYTSTACSHCRSKSFTIGGTTYYGQLPNMKEVINIAFYYSTIESMDISANSNTSLNFSTSRFLWSPNQPSSNYGWFLNPVGYISGNYKNTNYFACPVLEIPK